MRPIKIKCSVVRVTCPDGNTRDFYGVNHGEAWAVASDEVPKWTDALALFLTTDGRVLTREEAKREFTPKRFDGFGGFKHASSEGLALAGMIHAGNAPMEAAA